MIDDSEMECWALIASLPLDSERSISSMSDLLSKALESGSASGKIAAIAASSGAKMEPEAAQQPGARCWRSKSRSARPEKVRDRAPGAEDCREPSILEGKAPDEASKKLSENASCH